MAVPNVDLVQSEDWARHETHTCATTPAFLIHDGGGTVFSYHCLHPLQRCIYGIQNPHFETGDVFAGGLPEMGLLYASFIRTEVSRPDFPAQKNPDGSVNIIIGGWSLGGMLSLQIFDELELDPNIRIIGILMIDSVYPFRSDGPFELDDSDPFHTLGMQPILDPHDGRRKNQLLSQQAMAEARRMLRFWKIPEGFSRSRPRTILLRATECVPSNSGKLSMLDTYRQERTLGWDMHDADMFDDVINVQGHHFDLFHDKRITGTSRAVKLALDKLARYASSEE